MYNAELLETLAFKFDLLGNLLLEFPPDSTEDLFAYIASVMYDCDYAECLVTQEDGESNPEGQEYCNRVLEFIAPIVVDCGGINGADVEK